MKSHFLCGYSVNKPYYYYYCYYYYYHNNNNIIIIFIQDNPISVMNTDIKGGPVIRVHT